MVHVSGRDGLRVGQAQAVAWPRPPVGRRRRGRPRSGVCAHVSREHEADGLGEAEPSTRGAEGE